MYVYVCGIIYAYTHIEPKVKSTVIANPQIPMS